MGAGNKIEFWRKIMAANESIYIYRGESTEHEFLTPTALRDDAFDKPSINRNRNSSAEFNNLFLTMSDYQHLNVFSNIYLPSMMLDFTECKQIAECFANNYGDKKVVYSANYSRISELLSFRPDLYNALNGEKDTKTSELNLSLLGVVHWIETNNEAARNEKAINIFWPRKISKTEIGKTYPEDKLGYTLDLSISIIAHSPHERTETHGANGIVLKAGNAKASAAF
jgi:hypothetical protein